MELMAFSKKRWVVGAIFISVVCFGTRLYFKAEHYIPRAYEHMTEICIPGEVTSRAAALIRNYSRNEPIFLQLSDYFWENKKSLYALPYGTKGSEELMMKALALINHHLPKEIERLQCRRCVVVGNGFRILNSSLGETINKYDVVIRLNNAPVHNYEKDVGIKTTLRIFYPESAHFDLKLDINTDTLLVLVPYKNLDIQWLKTIINDEKRMNGTFWKKTPFIWNVNPQNIRILNPYYMEVAATKLLGYNHKTKKMIAKPTTGLMAISFAIHFCDLVHIAGFGYPEPSNKTQPIHYYEKKTMKFMAVSGHKVPLEAIAIRNLLQNKVINNLTYY